jgi:TRAP-type transport system periplasmic protein
MNRPSVRSGSLLAALLAFSGLAASQTTLTLSSWVPPAHTLTTSQAEWCEMLAAKAKGAVKCNVLPRAVSAPPGTFDAVRNGLADISFTVHGYTPGRFVTTQLAEFPFLGDSAEASSIAFQRIYAQHQAPDRQDRRPVRPEVPHRRRHGEHHLQAAGHERHAEAGA